MPAFNVTELELPTVCIFRSTLNPRYWVNIYTCNIYTHWNIYIILSKRFISVAISYHILELFVLKHLSVLHVQYIVNGTQEGITCAGVCLTYETESVETLVFENAIEKYDSMLLHIYAYIYNKSLPFSLIKWLWIYSC